MGSGAMLLPDLPTFSLIASLTEELDSSWGGQVTTLTEARVLIEEWRREYNQVRSHSALGYRPPVPEAIMPVIIPMRLT